MEETHPQWDEFIRRLEGPEGIDFQDKGDVFGWYCDHDYYACEQVLCDFDVDIERTLRAFRERGRKCDCEVLFNVAYMKYRLAGIDQIDECSLRS